MERQLYRALRQLERIQRRKQGEPVPPPVSVEFLGERWSFFLRNKANKLFVFSKDSHGTLWK